jgi:hypothetical protein
MFFSLDEKEYAGWRTQPKNLPARRRVKTNKKNQEIKWFASLKF